MTSPSSEIRFRSRPLVRTLIAALAFACTTVAFAAAPTRPGSPPSSRRSPASGATTTVTSGAAVLQTVLLDLLTYRPAVVETTTGTPPRIFFSPTPFTNKGRFPPPLKSRSPDWKKLLSTERQQVQDARDDMIRRASTGAGVKHARPSDPRIIVYRDGDPAYRDVTNFDDKPQVFRASLPGFSRDGRTAFVSLEFGWSGNFHWGRADYVLRRGKKGWTVTVRDIVRFF